MVTKPILTETEYRNALKRIDELISLDPKDGTSLFEELDTISTLVEAYENIHYTIDYSESIA
jgi:HTH-type transcriptional regulator/antitoxin HigA